MWMLAVKVIPRLILLLVLLSQWRILVTMTRGWLVLLGLALTLMDPACVDVGADGGVDGRLV